MDPAGRRSKTRRLTHALVDWLTARNRPPAVFTEIALAGSWGNRGRLDIASITIMPNYAGMRIDGYEVKVTRGDFSRDVENMKWSRYLGVCDRLFFATPPGLVSKDEVPSDAGLKVLTSKGTWQTVVQAPRHEPDRDDADVLMRTIWRRAGTSDLPERARRLRKLDAMEDAELAEQLSQRARRLIRQARLDHEDLERQRTRLARRRQEVKELAARSDGAPLVLEDLEEILRHVRVALSARAWMPEADVVKARRDIHRMRSILDEEA